MRRSISGGFAALIAGTLVLAACDNDLVAPDEGAAVTVVNGTDDSTRLLDGPADGESTDADGDGI